MVAAPPQPALAARLRRKNSRSWWRPQALAELSEGCSGALRCPPLPPLPASRLRVLRRPLPAPRLERTLEVDRSGLRMTLLRTRRFAGASPPGSELRPLEVESSAPLPPALGECLPPCAPRGVAPLKIEPPLALPSGSALAVEQVPPSAWPPLDPPLKGVVALWHLSDTPTSRG